MAEQKPKKEPLLKRIKDARLLRGKMDFTILLVITALCAFGLVMIFSASYYYAQHYSGANNDSFYYLKKQLVYLLIGYPTMLLIDRSGRVVCTRVGGMGSAKGFVDLFAKYLSEN